MIRTPNADFVRLLYKRLAKAMFKRALIANNLLGVPFAKCYSSHGIRSILSDAGFSDIGIRGRELTSVAPGPVRTNSRPTKWVRFAIYSALSGLLGLTVYPWMDVTARNSA